MTKKKKISIGKFFKILPKLFFKIFLVIIFLSVFSVIVLNWINPVTSSIMIQRKIEALITFSERQMIAYYWVGYNEISKQMVLAVIASEDQNFPFHFGFDFKQIEKAIEESERGKRLRGASTITQQVAKNLFLWEGRSFIRKGIEAYFTLLIEIFWTKKRIIEVYLNIAETGNMVFGIGAASKLCFNKHPKQLNIEQAALIAATLPNPREYSARNPSNYVQSKKDWIKKQMNFLGGIGYLGNL